MKKIILILSILLNIYLVYSVKSPNGKYFHINYRPNKDVSVQMKNMFDGSWDDVILVHGYYENNVGPAKDIVDHAEKTSGRPKGSFRIHEY
jgi:hypothetical protein